MVPPSPKLQAGIAVAVLATSGTMPDSFNTSGDHNAVGRVDGKRFKMENFGGMDDANMDETMDPKIEAKMDANMDGVENVENELSEVQLVEKMMGKEKMNATGDAELENEKVPQFTSKFDSIENMFGGQEMVCDGDMCHLVPTKIDNVDLNTSKNSNESIGDKSSSGGKNSSSGIGLDTSRWNASVGNTSGGTLNAVLDGFESKNVVDLLSQMGMQEKPVQEKAPINTAEFNANIIPSEEALMMVMEQNDNFRENKAKPAKVKSELNSESNQMMSDTKEVMKLTNPMTGGEFDQIMTDFVNKVDSDAKKNKMKFEKKMDSECNKIIDAESSQSPEKSHPVPQETNQIPKTSNQIAPATPEERREMAELVSAEITKLANFDAVKKLPNDLPSREKMAAQAQSYQTYREFVLPMRQSQMVNMKLEAIGVGVSLVEKKDDVDIVLATKNFAKIPSINELEESLPEIFRLPGLADIKWLVGNGVVTTGKSKIHGTGALATMNIPAGTNLGPPIVRGPIELLRATGLESIRSAQTPDQDERARIVMVNMNKELRESGVLTPYDQDVVLRQIGVTNMVNHASPNNEKVEERNNLKVRGKWDNSI